MLLSTFPPRAADARAPPRVQRMGVRTLICTDISRDGMLAGTNLELYARLNADYPMDLIASGGVSSLEDLRALKALGMAGAIVGKAYYTGNVTIPAALQALKE
jgi:phosphoribosylformimino-5-aminoimidazole carboxamide ribotide isomerase